MIGTSTCTTGRLVRTSVTTPETCGVSDMVTALGVSRSVIAGNGVPSPTRAFMIGLKSRSSRKMVERTLGSAFWERSRKTARFSAARPRELAIDHACQVLRHRLNAKLELLPLQGRHAVERNSRQEQQGKPQGCGKEDKITAKRPRCAQSRGDMRPPDRSV